MGFAERKALYEGIEAKRDHPLIAYVTSSRPNAQAQMASDVIPRIAEQVRCVGSEHTAVDLLIVSNGGDPTVAFVVAVFDSPEVSVTVSVTEYVPAAT